MATPDGESSNALGLAISAAFTTLGVAFTGWIKGRNNRAEQKEKFLISQRQMDETLRVQILTELKTQNDALEAELREVRKQQNEEREGWETERRRLITQRNEAYDSRDGWFDQARDMAHDWNNAMLALQSYHTRHNCACTLPDMIKLPPEIRHREDIPPCRQPKPGK